MSHKISRRDFLKFSSTSLFLAGANPEIVLAGNNDVEMSQVKNWGFSILQGLTTNDSTQLTIDVPKLMFVDYRLIDSETNEVLPSYYKDSATRDFSPWRVDKLGYEGLRFPCRYIFQVVDKKGAVLEERYLKTLDLNKRDTRIATLSCMLDWNPKRHGMWKSLKAAKPDILFFLGDNVYGDLGLRPGPELLWSRYITTRKNLGYYKWKELVPVIATWDDHDFGANDAGGHYRHKSHSADAFQAFFAQRPRDGVLIPGPGISSVFKAFGQQFIFVDDRTFRRMPSAHGKAFWGQDQVDWAFSHLTAQDGPVWIMQGTQTFDAHNSKASDAYEVAYEGEFDDVRKNLKSLNVPVVFASGDVHFSEIMKLSPQYLGFQTYELTSSSMHSFAPMTRPKNTRRTQVVWKENYFIVDLKPNDSAIQFDVSCCGYNQKLYFKESLSVG